MNINMNTCIQVKYGTMKIGFKPSKKAENAIGLRARSNFFYFFKQTEVHLN